MKNKNIFKEKRLIHFNGKKEQYSPEHIQDHPIPTLKQSAKTALEKVETAKTLLTTERSGHADDIASELLNTKNVADQLEQQAQTLLYAAQNTNQSVANIDELVNSITENGTKLDKFIQKKHKEFEEDKTTFESGEAYPEQLGSTKKPTLENLAIVREYTGEVDNTNFSLKKVLKRDAQWWQESIIDPINTLNIMFKSGRYKLSPTLEQSYKQGHQTLSAIQHQFNNNDFETFKKYISKLLSNNKKLLAADGILALPLATRRAESKKGTYLDPKTDILILKYNGGRTASKTFQLKNSKPKPSEKTAANPIERSSTESGVKVSAAEDKTKTSKTSEPSQTPYDLSPPEQILTQEAELYTLILKFNSLPPDLKNIREKTTESYIRQLQESFNKNLSSINGHLKKKYKLLTIDGKIGHNTKIAIAAYAQWWNETEAN